ncbi:MULTISPECIES: hypothetical protein [unclassified Rhizobium]|uniref:hypothetical protein n=1 Tax=unclassified Rhizobium TaxID=2613769 RepID=UPI0013C4CBF3|nr:MULTISPECIES: hypothetical protein [unclassified Rhizobium]
MNEIDAIPFSIEKEVVEASDFRWDGNGFGAGIGIAASGGGFLSARNCVKIRRQGGSEIQ